MEDNSEEEIKEEKLKILMEPNKMNLLENSVSEKRDSRSSTEDSTEEEEELVCPVDGKKFISKNHLEKHKEKHKKCEKCGEEMKTNTPIHNRTCIFSLAPPPIKKESELRSKVNKMEEQVMAMREAIEPKETKKRQNNQVSFT